MNFKPQKTGTENNVKGSMVQLEEVSGLVDGPSDFNAESQFVRSDVNLYKQPMSKKSFVSQINGRKQELNEISSKNFPGPDMNAYKNI